MNFNELMQRMRDIDTNAPIAEVSDVAEAGCGMPSAMMGMNPMPPEPMKQQDSVTMNVSMNGSGAGGIRDLMAILKNIDDVKSSPPLSNPTMSMDRDEIDMGEPEKFGDDDMEVMLKKKSGMDMIPIDDDYENEPDEMYGNMDSVTRTGDDLHSKGAEAPKVNGGGNPMSVKSGETFKLPSGDLKIRLESLYQDIKNR
jgi:hypothetical protein